MAPLKKALINRNLEALAFSELVWYKKQYRKVQTG